MESEPAFFNVMLREMGVQGIKAQEIYELDDNMLAFLAEPVHALIFLFRYHESDEKQQEGGSCPKQVWFANQTPEFACATFALLNIVNNIPGLELGRELRNFREFTQDMDPLSRGDAIDSFDFVKRIHNSFARENDLLQADMHIKGKADKLKKRQALAKAREARQAKKAANTPVKAPLADKSSDERTPSRASDRTKRPSPKKSVAEEDMHEDPDGDFGVRPTSKAEKHEQPNGVRRSNREPKPRKGLLSTTAPAEDAEAEEGFHFIAYMPINDHVWKLDGLDRFPQDLGSYSAGDGGDWKLVALPEIRARMKQYEGTTIQFNLMAILHDPLDTDRKTLLDNVKSIRAIDKKLDGIMEDWKAMEGAETKKDVITDSALELGITEADVEAAELRPSMRDKVEEDDLLKLIELRQSIIKQQAPLRATVRDALQTAGQDDEKARHRRHDYGTFVRSWLGALVEQEVLGALIGA